MPVIPREVDHAKCFARIVTFQRRRNALPALTRKKAEAAFPCASDDPASDLETVSRPYFRFFDDEPWPLEPRWIGCPLALFRKCGGTGGALLEVFEGSGGSPAGGPLNRLAARREGSTVKRRDWIWMMFAGRSRA